MTCLLTRLLVASVVFAFCVAGAAAQGQPPAGPDGTPRAVATDDELAATADDQQALRTGGAARHTGDVDAARVILRNRYHVRQMESVLVRAVEHAAELMSHRLTSVSPDVMALAGVPRAQGFRIEGYGLFFAVEVPRLSDSMAWALQVLSTGRDERTLASLRRLAEGQSDPATRADLERAARLLEAQMAGRVLPLESPKSAARPASAAVDAAAGADLSAAAPTQVAATSVAEPVVANDPAATRVATGPAAPPAPQPQPPTAQAEQAAALIGNPSAAYEGEVKDAICDALLDYALTLPLAPGEHVTVAARDAGFIAFPDAFSEMVTVTLTVKVDDLLAFRAQRIDRDEARRRVVVREF